MRVDFLAKVKVIKLSDVCIDSGKVDGKELRFIVPDYKVIIFHSNSKGAVVTKLDFMWLNIISSLIYSFYNIKQNW